VAYGKRTSMTEWTLPWWFDHPTWEFANMTDAGGE